MSDQDIILDSLEEPKVLIKSRKESPVGDVMMEERGWKDVRKEPHAKEYRQTLESKKGKEIYCPLRL